jgi:hypothetical protein
VTGSLNYICNYDKTGFRGHMNNPLSNKSINQE